MASSNSVVIGYTGRRGAGKTTAMTLDAYNYFLNGYTVYTNMRSLAFGVCIPEDKILELADSDDFQDCCLVLDEIQVLFDSRRSGRKQNVNFLYFIQQIRKRNVHMIYTTQFSRRVDVGIREHTDIEARPHMIKKPDSDIILCSVIYEDITYTLDTGIPRTYEKVFIANDVFDMFDTNERAQQLQAPIKEKKVKTK